MSACQALLGSEVDVNALLVDFHHQSWRAQYKDTEGVREVLSRSFGPYRSYYTKEAYKATVPPSVEIEKRINNLEIEVLVAVCNSEIVGTASVRIDEEGNLHIRKHTCRSA